MAKFVLPSGRKVETREQTWGQELHAITSAMADLEEFHYLKAAVIVPELSREDIAGLSSADGRALSKEINRIFEGRPEEQKLPFGKRSRRASSAPT